MRIGMALPQMGPIAEPDRVAEFASTAEDSVTRAYGQRIGSSRPCTRIRSIRAVRRSSRGRPNRRASRTRSSRWPWPPPPPAARGCQPARSTPHGTHPLFLGRTFASLDLLSRGRIDLGFGIGWMRTEYQALGIPFTKRWARLEETATVLRAMWTTDPVQHDGKLWHIPPSRLELRPVQPSGPLILLGGFGPGALDRVGRLADGWLPATSAADRLRAEVFGQMWQAIRRSAASAGRDPATLRRELRMNTSPGTPVDNAVQVALTAREAGYEGAFIDLTYVATGVDHALDLAARAMELYEKG
jgi:hypothetical protein